MLRSLALTFLFVSISVFGLAQSRKSISFFTSPTHFEDRDETEEVYEITNGFRFQIPILERISLVTGVLHTYQYQNLNQPLGSGPTKEPEPIENYFPNGKMEGLTYIYSSDLWVHLLQIPVQIKVDYTNPENRFSFYGTTGLRVGFNLYSKTLEKGLVNFNFGQTERIFLKDTQESNTNGLPDFTRIYAAFGLSTNLSQSFALNIEPYLSIPPALGDLSNKTPFVTDVGFEVAYKL